MDGEVLAVVMDWRDFGRNKAESRLEWIIRSRDLEGALSVEDCVLKEGDEGGRSVTCAWTFDVNVPLYGVVPLNLESSAMVDALGEIHSQ